MIYDFTYFSLINLRSLYEFVDIQWGALIIEVLNKVKSVKFIKIKGPREVRPPWDLTQKHCLEGWDKTIFENLHQGLPREW